MRFLEVTLVLKHIDPHAVETIDLDHAMHSFPLYSHMTLIIYTLLLPSKNCFHVKVSKKRR